MISRKSNKWQKLFACIRKKYTIISFIPKDELIRRVISAIFGKNDHYFSISAANNQVIFDWDEFRKYLEEYFNIGLSISPENMKWFDTNSNSKSEKRELAIYDCSLESHLDVLKFPKRFS